MDGHKASMFYKILKDFKKYILCKSGKDFI